MKRDDLYRAILTWLGLAPRHELDHARANEQYWRDVAQSEQAALAEERERVAELRREVQILKRARDEWIRSAEERRHKYEAERDACADLVDSAKRKLRRIEDLQQENARLKDRILLATLYLDGSREHAERAGEE